MKRVKVRGSETPIISQATGSDNGARSQAPRVYMQIEGEWGAQVLGGFGLSVSGRDSTFAIGAAWAHWAVMHRLSAGHPPRAALADSSHLVTS
ncbi:hypothetical protein N7488_012204 [Penicillium malachiteum]|nr:hypothetical protein N7488_012204 [Penicillium malachiteum]